MLRKGFAWAGLPEFGLSADGSFHPPQTRMVGGDEVLYTTGFSVVGATALEAVVAKMTICGRACGRSRDFVFSTDEDDPCTDALLLIVSAKDWTFSLPAVAAGVINLDIGSWPFGLMVSAGDYELATFQGLLHIDY